MELLERVNAVETLVRAFESAERGRGRTVLVSGEAGIGKTALVTAFAAAHRDARVLWGGCEALFSPRPLGPLYDIDAQTGGRFTPSLRGDARGAELFSAVLAELEHSPVPTLFVIEDAHWADAATLDLIKFVARRVHRVRALFVVTYRDNELDELHPLRMVLGDVPANASVRLPLAPLSEPAVAELARRASRSADGLFAATGGNPFLVTEALRAEGVSANIRDAVLARVARQPAPVRAVLELAAIVPSRIEAWLVARVLGDDADTAIASAVASGLLHVDRDSVAFRHELARMALEQSIAPSRSSRLHAKLLAALAADRDSRVPFTRLVHHAAGAADAAAVLRYAPQAARQAAVHGAHREAAALYALALACPDGLDPRERAELLEQRAYQCYLTDQIADAAAARNAALAIWRDVGDVRRQGDTLRWLSRLSWFQGLNAKAEVYANEAVALLETLPPGRELAWAYSNRAHLHMLAARNAEAIEWGNRAIDLAKSLHDEEILAHALNNVGSAEGFGCDEGRAKLERSLAIALANRFEEHAGRAYSNLASAAVTIRDYAGARRWFDEAAHYFGSRDLDAWWYYVLAWRARMHFETGEWNAADESASIVLSKRGASAIHRIPALAVLSRLRVRLGGSGAEALLDEAHELAKRTGELQRIAPVAAARAEAAWMRNDLASVSDDVAAAYELAVERGNPRQIGELGYWLWKAGVIARLALDVDDPYGAMIAGRWRDAADRWLRIGCPYERALALADGDDDAIAEALGILDRLGAIATAAFTRDRLRARGAKRIPRGPRATTAGNPAGLTAREMQVLKLLAQGLANAEIARRLVRSPKTVDHHVSSILAKLDVRSRAEAAEIARSMKAGDGPAAR